MSIQDPTIFPRFVHHPTQGSFWCPDLAFLQSMKGYEAYELEPFTGPRKHIPFKGCVSCLKLKVQIADLELKVTEGEIELQLAIQARDAEIKSLKAALATKKGQR